MDSNYRLNRSYFEKVVTEKSVENLKKEQKIILQ